MRRSFAQVDGGSGTMNARYSAFSLALCAAVGCGSGAGPAPAMSYPGASTAPHPSAAASARPAAKQRDKWERFAEVVAWEPVNPEPFVSSGHFGGRLAVNVRVSPEARRPYAELVAGGELPRGSVIAAFHTDARYGRPGPVLAMVKGARDWEYLSLDAEGGIVERGALPLCLRCHAEGIADQLFGLPKK